MIKIQRLTAPLRNMARLSKAEAKSMHVISEGNIPVTVPKRYNVRVKEDTIAKYTLTDNQIDVTYMLKKGDKYIPSCSRTTTF